MNEEMFLVKRSDTFSEGCENIGLFSTRNLAEEYIKKHKDSDNYYIQRLKVFDDFTPEKTVVVTIISTKNGKDFNKYYQKAVVSDKYTCIDNENLEIFEEDVTIKEECEVVIKIVSNRTLTIDEKLSLIKKRYKENYSSLLQAHEYKIGDEVTKGGKIYYVTKILNDEMLYIFTPSERIEVAYISKIKPTGKFSEEVANFFSDKHEIKAKERE